MLIRLRATDQEKAFTLGATGGFQTLLIGKGEAGLFEERRDINNDLEEKLPNELGIQMFCLGRIGK